ncbi:hypothetical protein GQ607_013330 [Colletotrichum asianum]|uniref:Uncharacterized protein n=1 Tax=Colletotrichum asianum TaxID=702518 RepID=A0A8H3ZMS0_9PEZI|nr:hypothetical protein GQ607_013330 [Colletotrichum asianum]
MKTRQRPYLQHPQSLESTYPPKTKTNKHKYKRKYKRPRGIQDTPTASPKFPVRTYQPPTNPQLPRLTSRSYAKPPQPISRKASSSTAKPCRRSLNVAIQTWLRLAASKRRHTRLTVSVDLIREKKRLTLTS